MPNWSEGYMTEIEYVYTYHSHLNPLHMQLVLASAGVAPPQVKTACELGFGQGVSINMHAAASSSVWYGTDFHPGHTAFAQELATASSLNTFLFDQSFADFCSRPDLPDFELIVLHGIWSWISDANRSVIIDFVRRKLKPGGVLSVSYNTLHGWSGMLPTRDLLTEHAQRMSAPGLGIASRVDVALEFADQVLAACPKYAKSNLLIVQKLIEMKGQDRRYVAGEYFSRDWQPMPFSDVADWLASAKLMFVCSAEYSHQVDAVRLTQPQQNLLKDIPDPQFRETVRDFCLEQSFRKDYWIKGGGKLSPQDCNEIIRAQRVVLVRPADNVHFRTLMADNRAAMTAVEGKPLLDALADHKPCTLGDLAFRVPHMTFDRMLQFVLVMAGDGYIQSAQDDHAISTALVKGSAQRLNGALMQKAKTLQGVNYLASPVTGGGVPVARYHQLFLLARSKGLELPAEWAQITLHCLAARGERVERAAWADRKPDEVLSDLVQQAQARGHKNPQAWAQSTLAFLQEHNHRPVEPHEPLLSPEDELCELIAQAKVFFDRHLPMLVLLGVA